MLFKPELAEKILKGEKVQTRRVIKLGEWLEVRRYRNGSELVASKTVFTGQRIKWQVGGHYAIQLGRGKAAVGRFLLLDIRREWVRDISEADAIAEGVELNHYYCDVGAAPDFFPVHRCDPVGRFLELFESINGKEALDKEVWVLVFEVEE